MSATDLPPPANSFRDTRLEQLRSWLEQVTGCAELHLAPASEDASFRRYFRVTLGAMTRIAMDAPPPLEDCAPFVKVARLLRQAGVHAPEILAQDTRQGFLLLEDLGTQTYLDVLNEANAGTLFGEAVDALILWQQSTRSGTLPPYDEALLRRELELFPHWYVARHLDVTLTAPQRAALEQTFALLVQRASSQPRVFVHRDYMPRNLMVSIPNPGVIDFQDAVEGPATYDLVSLFRDAFISWPEEQVRDWTARYWERAKRAALPLPGDFKTFHENFEWMGVQRHLKVLGIFARIHHRDGKPGYLSDAPRFINYVRIVAARYRDLAPLRRLCDEVEGRRMRPGHTR